MTTNNHRSMVTLVPSLTGYRFWLPWLTMMLIVLLIASNASPVPASASSSASSSYTVASGDSLYLIAQRFGTSVGTLMSLNDLSSDIIKPGQVLKIPVPDANSSLYQVKSGDTLYLISLRFGTSVDKLTATNNLTTTGLLVGQILTLPSDSTYYVYNVKSGDTLYLIALKFSISIDKIIQLNQLTSDKLYIDQILRLPRINSESLPQPTTLNWTVPGGTVLVHAASGQNLWTLAQQYNTSEAAIMQTNHLHTDLIMVDQPLFIPLNSTKPATVSAPVISSKVGYGELLNWEFVNWIFDTENQATLKDLITGKQFRVKRLGGSNHSDCEPLTPNDTKIMKEIYNGTWTWDRRAVLVQVGNRTIAGSMAGMPHSIRTIYDNDFPGHFDLHFLHSRTHNTGQEDPKHQVMVQKAAGY